mmetsp:Transcript_445/g.1245  ORF Transcript_445/g.1245 Transcript_445/m.1245 type:complete len:185 (-) Transcript_445:212-766(-)|eukprot:CAMPEP_0168740608 /NCGR_PEP_ID=MMETSP0724-20121128/12076_1 /TAXON_ID=265536 /ORGANISM="Amphiprora sp., Strain CCMP467" /LENGTH=184 /DNA_ID=CAMNT_0008788067 /DNA_START=47 /DNA_END=601 /DNA_ORIENTATION=+
MASEATSSTAPGQRESRPMDQVVKAALEGWDIKYQDVPAEKCQTNVPLITFGLNGQASNYQVLLSMDLVDDIFALYYTSPTKIDERHRPAVVEYFMRINYNVMLGHFDLDQRDGEVRFKVSTITKGSFLSIEMVQHMIGVATNTMDKFFPGLMAIQYGNKTPLEALNEINNEATVQRSSEQGAR